MFDGLDEAECRSCHYAIKKKTSYLTSHMLGICYIDETIHLLAHLLHVRSRAAN